MSTFLPFLRLKRLPSTLQSVCGALTEEVHNRKKSSKTTKFAAAQAFSPIPLDRQALNESPPSICFLDGFAAPYVHALINFLIAFYLSSGIASPLLWNPTMFLFGEKPKREAVRKEDDGAGMAA